jgi:hypothetical protein
MAALSIALNPITAANPSSSSSSSGISYTDELEDFMKAIGTITDSDTPKQVKLIKLMEVSNTSYHNPEIDLFAKTLAAKAETEVDKFSESVDKGTLPDTSAGAQNYTSASAVTPNETSSFGSVIKTGLKVLGFVANPPAAIIKAAISTGLDEADKTLGVSEFVNGLFSPDGSSGTPKDSSSTVMGSFLKNLFGINIDSPAEKPASIDPNYVREYSSSEDSGDSSRSYSGQSSDPGASNYSLASAYSSSSNSSD